MPAMSTPTLVREISSPIRTTKTGVVGCANRLSPKGTLILKLRPKPSKSALLVVAGCCGAFLAGAVAFASTQTSTAVIHGCYSPKTGFLRRIPAKGHCKSGEKSLNWNGKGIQGVQGTQGIKGDAGQPGADGSPGPQGPPGAAVVLRATDNNLTVGGLARLSSLDPNWQTTTTTFGSTGWTQAADQIDTFAGSISYTLEAACGGSPDLNVKFLVDGAVVMQSDLPTTNPGTTISTPLSAAAPSTNFANILFEPGAPTHHF